MEQRVHIGRRGWWHLCLVISVAISTLISVGGLASASANSHNASGGPTLNILAAPPGDGFNPATSASTTSRRVMELIYDTLVQFNAHGDVVPDIARSWTNLPKGAGYIFHLQPNAKFSNGAPITASDVKYSLKEMKSSAVIGPLMTEMTGVTVVNSTTVEVHLQYRSRVFLSVLASNGSAAILDQSAVQGNPNYFERPTDTSGPWSIVSYTPLVSIKLTANKYYWATGYPKIKNIDYSFTNDATTANAALQTGTADMYFPDDPTDAIRLAKDGIANMYPSPQAGATFWGFGSKSKPPFNSLDVRLAIAYVAPRAARFKVCWDSVGAESFGSVVMPGNWAYTSSVNVYNLPANKAFAKATKLLDEAGWVMGPNGVRVSHNVAGLPDGTPFNVTVPYENNWEQAGCSTLLLQSALKPLGINVTPQAYDAATFYQQVAQGSFEMYHGGDSFPTVDLEFEEAYTCGGSAADLVSRWCNKRVDKLVADAARSSETAAKALYAQVDQIIEKQLPNIVTGAQYSITETTKKLHNFQILPTASNRGLIYATLTS